MQHDVSTHMELKATHVACAGDIVNGIIVSRNNQHAVKNHLACDDRFDRLKEPRLAQVNQMRKQESGPKLQGLVWKPCNTYEGYLCWIDHKFPEDHFVAAVGICAELNFFSKQCLVSGVFSTCMHRLQPGGCMLTEEIATCWLAALLDMGVEPGPKLAGRCLECCPEHAPRHQIACWPQHAPAAVLVVLAACHRLPRIHTHDYQVDLAHFSFFVKTTMLRTGAWTGPNT